MAGMTNYKIVSTLRGFKRIASLTHVGEQQRDPMNPRMKLKNGMASARRNDKIVSPIVDDLHTACC